MSALSAAAPTPLDEFERSCHALGFPRGAAPASMSAPASTLAPASKPAPMSMPASEPTPVSMSAPVSTPVSTSTSALAPGLTSKLTSKPLALFRDWWEPLYLFLLPGVYRGAGLIDYGALWFARCFSPTGRRMPKGALLDSVLMLARAASALDDEPAITSTTPPASPSPESSYD